jgi:hypothetical protein
MKERELGLEKHPRLHFVEGQTEFSPCKRFLLRKKEEEGWGNWWWKEQLWRTGGQPIGNSGRQGR